MSSLPWSSCRIARIARPALLACALLTALAADPRSQQDPPPAPAPKGQDDQALRERAFGAENQGNFAAAGAAFLQLAAAEPMRVEWTVAAGRCLGRSGQFAEAIDLLVAAETRFPGIVDVPAMLARTYLLQAEQDRGVLDRRELWQRAADTAERVLQLEPAHDESRLLLAQARFLQGQRDAARRQAELARELRPERPGAHILLGRLALEELRELLAAHQQGALDPARTADLVANIDQARQRARQSLQRAAELDTRAHPHLLLAQLALLDGKETIARGHLLDALAIDPDATSDHSLLQNHLDWQAQAATYAALRERYRARSDQRAAKLATLHWYEGRALYAGGEWAAARAQFDLALANNPHAHSAHFYAAFASYRLDDFDAAERHAAAYAADQAVAFAEFLKELAAAERAAVASQLQFLADRAYRANRREAARDLNHVLALLVDSADAWNNRALLCRDTGRFEAALDAYRRAVELEPDSPQLLNDYAVVMQYHLPTPTNLARARDLYQRAVQLADAQLRDANLPPATRERVQQAREHARQNLAALPR
jgi:tetratricopeptide (TPR) repeat protein